MLMKAQSPPMASRTLEVPADRVDHPTSTPAPWARWSALLLLMVAELAVLAVQFSTGEIPDVDDGMARSFRGVQWVFHRGIGVALPALAVGGPFFLAGWRRLGFRSYSPSTTWRLGLGNLAAFAAHYWLTGRIIEEGALASSHPLAWFGAWASTGLVALMLWSLAVVPLGLWRALAGRFLAMVAIGGAVGLVGSQTRQFWWNPLKYPTFWAVRTLLAPICPKVVYRPDEYLLGTPEFTVQIMPSCSGYEGIGLIWVFSTAFLILNRRSLRFPRALLLIPLGTLAIWLANAARLAALILLGSWYSPELAEGAFHSLAGWVGLNVVAIGVMLLAQRSNFFRVVAKDEVFERVENPTPPYLAPLLALIAAGMIAGAFPTGGFDRYYPACVAATLGTLWPFRRRYAAMGPWRGSWEAVGVGVLTFVGWMALEPYYRAPSGVDTATPAALAGMSRLAALGWLASRVFGSVVTVPLAEELAFRGFLTRRLITADFQDARPGQFTWPSFLGSSIAFGLLHQRWLAGTLAGMAYAWAYYRRGRIADPVLAHATTNALIAAWVLATGDWSTWS
jgi:exosortase E/protease (VPEID-CTERM system)